MPVLLLLAGVASLHLPAQEPDRGDELVARVRDGGVLHLLEHRRGDDGRMLVAQPGEDEQATSAMEPLIGPLDDDVLAGSGMAGLLALLCQGRGGLLAMTDAERHFEWIGVDATNVGLRQFLARPLPSFDGAAGRAELLDRMLAIDVLHRRGCRNAAPELQVLATNERAPAMLRDRAAAALRGQPPPPATRRRLDAATLPVPAAFDVCVVVDHARLPDLGWITAAGRRLNMLFLARMVDAGTMAGADAQRACDQCSEFPFDVVLQHGNVRLDQSCHFVRLEPEPAPPRPPFRACSAAVGAFEHGARWQQLEQPPRLELRLGEVPATLELQPDQLLLDLGAEDARPRPGIARELLADTGAAIRVVAPAGSRLLSLLAFPGMPARYARLQDAPVLRGELRLAFDDGCRVELRATTRDERTAEALLARGRELLGKGKAELLQGLPAAVRDDAAGTALLDAVLAADLAVDGTSVRATITVRDLDHSRLVALLERLVDPPR